MELDPDLIIPNRDLTLEDGAVVAWGESATREDGYYGQLLKAMAEHYDIPLDVPVRELNDAQIELILYGTGEERIKIDYTGRDGRRAQCETSFEGVIPNLKRRYQETTSDYMRSRIESYMAYRALPGVRGQAAAARGAGGDGGRQEHCRGDEPAGGQGAGVGGGAAGEWKRECKTQEARRKRQDAEAGRKSRAGRKRPDRRVDADGS